jgi:hypothetical protein
VCLQWSVYNGLKQRFEPDTTANRLDKLNKLLNALQSTGESIHCALRRTCTWPASGVERALACWLFPHQAQGGAMDACSSSWSRPQLPAHQEWVCWCKETGCHPPPSNAYSILMTPWTLLQACRLPLRPKHPYQCSQCLGSPPSPTPCLSV